MTLSVSMGLILIVISIHPSPPQKKKTGPYMDLHAYIIIVEVAWKWGLVTFLSASDIFHWLWRKRVSHIWEIWAEVMPRDDMLLILFPRKNLVSLFHGWVNLHRHRRNWVKEYISRKYQNRAAEKQENLECAK